LSSSQKSSIIQNLHAREILDSRGNPALEVDLTLGTGETVRAAVPSGASTGSKEAYELRDGDPARFHGKGLQKVVRHVNVDLKDLVIGQSVLEQDAIDQAMIQLDGTENKYRLGANAILGVSLAVCRAGALASQKPLYEYIGHRLFKGDAHLLPTPMFNILNGGVHADNNVDFQEFMIAPVGASSFREAVEWAAEMYQTLKSLLKTQGLTTSVGDEGGFAPELKSNEHAIEIILEAISQSGFQAGKQIAIALDPAASEFYEDGFYVFKKSDQSRKTSDEMIAFWNSWIKQYPILMLEDGLAEDDWEGWVRLTQNLGKKVQLVGDDIFVTNPAIIKKAIQAHVANASLIKLNQIGTVTETIEAMNVSRAAGYHCVISHRSGETTDDFIADFAVGTDAAQIKTGAPCRGERVAKYNQLMRIEEALGKNAKFAGVSPFKIPTSDRRHE